MTKIALAQITTDPGQISANVAKILAAIAQARGAGCDCVSFPELTIPGYCALDLFAERDFIRTNRHALSEIAKHCNDITAIVGFAECDDHADRSGDRPLLYNAAAILQNGTLAGIQKKRLIPNYGIFSEDRYFQSATESHPFTIGQHRLAIQICEDLWDDGYTQKTTAAIVALGADIIFNISASPFEVGKYDARRRAIARLYNENKFRGYFCYTNLIGSFDGYEGEVVFDGRSLALGPSGQIITEGAAFEEDLVILTVPHAGKSPHIRSYDDTEIIYKALVLGIRDFYRRLGLKKAFIGLSGGIDSALVAALAVEALGEQNVTGVTMPSIFTSRATLSDALLLADNLGISCLTRPIEPELNAWRSEFRRVYGAEPGGITLQNKQARIRGTILMECSSESKAPAVVLNTGNKTEIATGYCTLYGDMCGALAVLGDVDKLRVYELSRFVNQRAAKEIIPHSTIERIPSAELAEGQEDRLNLPADYPVLVPVANRLIESNETIDQVVNSGFDRSVVEQTARLIEMNEFKRRQAAPAIRVTPRAFGVGRRVPMRYR